MDNSEKFEPEFEPKLEIKEKSTEEKEEIEMIAANSSLSLQDKIELVLVYLREKPASWPGLEVRFYKTGSEKEKQKELEKLNQEGEEILKLLEILDLPHYTYKDKEEEEKTIRVGYHFIIAQDLEKLNQLKKAIEGFKEGDLTKEKDIGLALGYPESAVEGFIKKETFDVFDKAEGLRRLPKEKREKLKKEGVFKFLTFTPSEDSWEEELELVRRYQKIIQEKAPRMYDEVIKSTRDFEKRF